MARLALCGLVQAAARNTSDFALGAYRASGRRILTLIERKRRLAKLAKHAIRFSEHLTDDSPVVFDHVCRMGLEGIVSKRTDAPYRSGLSKTWLKMKNPASDAVRREREEDWSR